MLLLSGPALLLGDREKLHDGSRDGEVNGEDAAAGLHDFSTTWPLPGGIQGAGGHIEKYAGPPAPTKAVSPTALTMEMFAKELPPPPPLKPEPLPPPKNPPPPLPQG